MHIRKDTPALQKAQSGDEGDPQHHHLVSGAGGGEDVALQTLQVDPLQHRPEPKLEDLVRTQGNVLDRDQLEQHIQNPNGP